MGQGQVYRPVLTVLLYAALAAGMGSMGVIPILGRRQISLFVLGVANALAAGLMLGAVYASEQARGLAVALLVTVALVGMVLFQQYL